MVSAVYDQRSIGIRRYVERLAGALASEGVVYEPRPRPGAVYHFHLANSTRRVIWNAARQGQPYLVTVHDVLPRARALRPVQRRLVLPLVLRGAACVVVHSAHAASLLREGTGHWLPRVEVIAHAAPAPGSRDHRAARAALARSACLPELAADGPPLFVLPGILRRAKLVAETLRAAEPLLAAGRLRLLLAGAGADLALAADVERAGALLLRAPDPATYEHAIVAADAVLCLRADTVGESNGPLLDALGAWRPALVTAVGSAPEIAGDAARTVEPTVAAIRAGLTSLLDPGERETRARAARRRARELTWERAAQAHRALFEEFAGV